MLKRGVKGVSGERAAISCAEYNKEGGKRLLWPGMSLEEVQSDYRTGHW